MIRQCPYCPAELKSERRFNIHLALEHESYPDGTSVSTATILSLIRVYDRVHFLLLKFAECRRPDNGDLYIWYLRTWTDSLLYDATPQGYAWNDPAMPRNIIGHHKLRWTLAQLETVRRMREKCQADDRKMYHRCVTDENGKKTYLDEWTMEHRCILPSPEQQALADAREQTMRMEMGRT